MFAIAIVFACLILIPYAYYAARINIYYHGGNTIDYSDDVVVRQVEGDYPAYTHFWITAVSAVFFIAMRLSLAFWLRPLVCMWLVPSKTPKEDRDEVAKKIEDHLMDSVVYGSFTVWGWFICKDQDWMPWFLGGQGQLENAFVDLSFSPVQAPLLFYGLVNFGYRFEALFT